MPSDRDRRPLVLVAVGFAAGVVAYPSLPGPYLGAVRNAPAARLAIAFLLPATAAAICFLLHVLWSRDPLRDRSAPSEATYRAIVRYVVTFVVALHILILVQLSGTSWPGAFAPRLVVVLFGLALIGIGNLLPRTKPNLVFGMRTARMLADRSAWVQAHRAVGYITVVLGLAVTISGAFLPARAIGVVVGIFGVGAVAAVIACYPKASRA